MRSQSLQESLLEEILSFDDMSFPSFTASDRAHHTPHKYPSPQQSMVLHKPSAASINDLQDEILRMRVQAARIAPKRPPADISRGYREKMKTEASDGLIQPQGDKSVCTLTRRSSLDESLYERAMRGESAKKSWAKKKRMEKSLNEVIDCTYHPKINQTSKEIFSKLNRQQLNQKNKLKKEQQIQKIQQQKQRRALEECSFTPNLSKSRYKSKQLSSIRVQEFEHENRNVFQELYEESKTREAKKKMKEREALLNSVKAPQIDCISKQITGNSSFNERMIFYQKKKAYKDSLRKQDEQKQNSKLHHPKVNPSSNNRHLQVPIGEHLYSQSRKSKPTAPEVKKVPKINKKSAEVYEERKVVAFYQIFKLLDDDQDGVISSQYISLQMLPREILKIIYPLIDQLQSLEVKLQEFQFISSLENLFQTLSIHERNIILGFTPTPKVQPQHSFKPKLNPRSRQIAEEIQRNDLSISQFCTIREAEKEKQLETQRYEQTRRELQKCTFHPKIITRFRY